MEEKENVIKADGAKYVKKGNGVLAVSALMFAFGTAELITGFRHEFLTLVISEHRIATLIGAGLDCCYVFGGIFLFIYKKWSLPIAFCLLIVDVAGRLAMAFTEMYPVNSFMHGAGIAAGTLTTVIFTIFVFIKMKNYAKCNESLPVKNDGNAE